MSDFLNNVDAILLGRVAYQLLADYWPVAIPKTTMPQNPGEEHPLIIEKMNSLPKIILSKTLEKVEWKNSRLIKEDVKKEILKFKQQPGKDLVLFGGADIASTLLQLGLIDEYRIILNPVVLSNGRPFFKDIKEQLSLQLLKTRTFHVAMLSSTINQLRKSNTFERSFSVFILDYLLDGSCKSYSKNYNSSSKSSITIL